YFAHYDIDAAENYHHVGNGVAETEVFENRQIDETRRTHPITVWIRSAVADEIKAELALGRFNSAVRFAYRRSERPDLHLGIHDWPRLNLGECLFQKLDTLAHLQRAHHQTIISVTMFAEWNPEFESWIKPVAVHFANVVVHAACAQHRTGNSGADREIGRKFPDVLRPGDDDLVSQN